MCVVLVGALVSVCVAKPAAGSRAVVLNSSSILTSSGLINSTDSTRRLQSAQMAGGEPPAEVEYEQCDISSVFGHLMAIQSDPACRAGCAGGTGQCPDQWYPSEKCAAPLPPCRLAAIPTETLCGVQLMTLIAASSVHAYCVVDGCRDLCSAECGAVFEPFVSSVHSASHASFIVSARRYRLTVSLVRLPARSRCMGAYSGTNAARCWSELAWAEWRK